MITKVIGQLIGQLISLIMKENEDLKSINEILTRDNIRLNKTLDEVMVENKAFKTIIDKWED